MGIDDLTIADYQGVLRGLTCEFHTIWIVDKMTLNMTLIHSSGVSTIKKAVQMGKDYPNFDEGFAKYIATYVAPCDRERMTREISSKEILRQLEQNDFYVVDYLRVNDAGESGYHQLFFANADTSDGRKCFVYGFRDIDRFIKNEQARNHKLEEQLDIIQSVSKAFNVIYYIDMKDYSYFQLGVNIDGVTGVIDEAGNAVEGFKRMLHYMVTAEQVPEMREFVNLDTLNDRLKSQDWVAHQFFGPVGGWSEGIFIAANRDENGNCEHAIWATRNIDEMKRKENHLVFASNTDELTGFFNRRAYEAEAKKYDNSILPANLVYVSIDVNGLKSTNDTLGHEAGDELILGACECMREAFGPYGTLYRTGGDEFIAILRADDEKLKKIQEKLEELTSDWQGNYMKGLSLACGYVKCSECRNSSFHKIGVLADHKMYEAKSLYYSTKGIDRRGLQDAHSALIAMYMLILKVNLTDDTYRLVDSNENSCRNFHGISEKFSESMHNFVTYGMVHPDDAEEFKAKTSAENICRYLAEHNEPLTMSYRKNIGNEYRVETIEFVKAADYTDENRTVYMYAK